ncbi:MAG: hypothetical protein QM803_20660 [Rhodocyclaceae bacterium]
MKNQRHMQAPGQSRQCHSHQALRRHIGSVIANIVKIVDIVMALPPLSFRVAAQNQPRIKPQAPRRVRAIHHAYVLRGKFA